MKEQEIKNWWVNLGSFSNFLNQLIRDGYTIIQIVPTGYQTSNFSSGNTLTMNTATILVVKNEK